MALGARCFYFSDLHQQFVQNWIEAEQMCRDLGKGSTLASIRNQEEQDFVDSKVLFIANRYYYFVYKKILTILAVSHHRIGTDLMMHKMLCENKLYVWQDF